MSQDTLSTADQPIITDKLVPIDLDKNPITYSGNPAELEGILFEVGRFYLRSGLFKPLFEHGAVLLSNGKLQGSVEKFWGDFLKPPFGATPPLPQL